MTILNGELSHFPPLKKQTQIPKGVDSAILASQPFLLITKPTEENRTRPPWFLLNFSSASVPVLEQRHTKQHPYLKRRNVCLSNPLSQRKKQQTFKVRRLFSGCTEEYTVARHQLCRTLVPRLLVVLFICISISHSCMSLLHGCGSK